MNIIKSYDGKEIVAHEWLDVKEPKGVVQIAHGMVDHATRFENLAKFLNEKGYYVVADDHRGHGETDRESLGYCKGDMFKDTLKDMAIIAKFYKDKYKNLKYILFGFSYGSFLTQAFISRYNRFLDGAVIAGGAKMNRGLILAAIAISKIGKTFKGEKASAKLIKKFTFDAYDKSYKEGRFLSISEKNNFDYDNDELCKFTCSYNFYFSFFKGINSLYTKEYEQNLNRDLPLLIVSGKEDAVGGKGKLVNKLYSYYKKIGVKKIKIKLYDNSRHEFLNEEGNISKMYDILEFINRC